MKSLPLVLCLILSGCDSSLPGYVVKQGFRHGSLLLKAQPIDEILKNPALDPKTEHYLKLSKEVLAYAQRDLGMRVGANYQQYIPLNRDWVTQIVMAAKKDSLTPHLFSYPIVGDLPYRGFYDEADAEKLEAKLASEGFDVFRRKVEAFSTTGWLPDPVISTMFSDESRFVELLFHELTHSTFYFADQADFNEAFASWMGFKASLEFVKSAKSSVNTDLTKIETELTRGHEFQIRFASVIKEILEEGRKVYARPNPTEQREPYFAWIKTRLSKEPFGAAMDEKQWNNALILSLGTYYETVPAIERYAAKNKLSPREFLAKVAQTGSSIVPEILAEGAKP